MRFDIPRVVITAGVRWTYFEWFLLGLYRLQQKGEIILEIKLEKQPWSSLLFKVSNSYAVRGVNRLRRTREPDSYNMDGYVVGTDGVKQPFTIDSADAPFLFDEAKLKQGWSYFKMQCPVGFAEDGFELAPGVFIPWCDHAHDDPGLALTERGPRREIGSINCYLPQIHPLMIGPRCLAKGTSRKLLEAGYINYLKARSLCKKARIMCYFGNAWGPKPEVHGAVDYDWEADLMGTFAGRVSHPNEKRARLAELIGRAGGDARVITTGFADTGVTEHPELVVPLEDFCTHVAGFEYNANVSGYRLSIPNRFIESFMVGTAIFTDKLHVRWYLPFGPEVVETADMGYLRDGDVDWARVERDMAGLPASNSKAVVDAFESKWAPEVVARYIVDTVLGEEGDVR